MAKNLSTSSPRGVLGASAPSNILTLPVSGCRHRNPQLTGAQLRERGIQRILPKTPEPAEMEYPAFMIIAAAMLDQLTPQQKQDAQNAVHRFYNMFGTEQAMAASAFMGGLR